MTSHADQQLIPLVVGVTGHRDLRRQDEAALREQVASFFAELQSSLPHTPLVLMSALAEGADRLVAETAIANNVILLVSLPAEQSLYESTFLSSESIDPFRALLAKAAAVWVVPECETPADMHRAGIEPAQYAAAGAYLVQNSQIILALWDGRKSDSVGGTSDIVRFALEGIPQSLAGSTNLLAAAQTAQVVQIATPRQNHEPDKVPRIIRQVFWPTPVEKEISIPKKKMTGKAERRLNEFNRDTKRYAASLTERRQKSRRFLLPDDIATTLGRAERQLLDAFANADSLALNFQRRLLRRLWLTTFITLLALVAFQLYFTLPNQLRELIIAYVALAIVALLVHYLTGWQQFETKYLDYRALAEGFRIQLFWRIAGLDEKASDCYLSRQQGELSWIREAIHNRFLMSCRVPPPRAELDRQLDTVDQHWVQDQLSYFQRAAQRFDNRMFQLKCLAKFFVGGGLIIGIVKALAYQHLILEVTVVMMPILAALLAVYIRTRKFQEQSRQYARMALLFRRAASQLSMALQRHDTEVAQSLVRHLGQESLIENGDWVILHRDRPLEGPNVL